MIDFILGVLIIAALLAAVFGRGVGQAFVLGVSTMSAICIGIAFVLLFPLIWGFFFAPSTPSPSSSYSSGYQAASSGGYQPSYQQPSAAPSYQPPASPAYQQPTRQAADVGGGLLTSPTPSAPAPPTVTAYRPAPPDGHGPRVGMNLRPLSAADQSDMAGLRVPQGCGVGVGAVSRGGPAESAGVAQDDVIVAADDHWVTSADDFDSYEAAKGAGVPIRLHMYRSLGVAWRSMSLDVTPR